MRKPHKQSGRPYSGSGNYFKSHEGITYSNENFPKMDQWQEMYTPSGWVSPIAHQFNTLSILSPQSVSAQAKLEANTPGDKYEKQADRMADLVMRIPAPKVQRNCAPRTGKEEEHIRQKPFAEQISTINSSSNAQRKCANCEEEKVTQVLQTKSNSDSAGIASSTLTDKVEQSNGGGQALDNATRTFMESRFGADFSQIRIHADRGAIQMNRQINARAFTFGNDIYFNTGQYDLTSTDGKKLLAHELTHTLQQGSNFMIRRSPQDWLQSSPYIEQWSASEIENEINELEEWLRMQMESSEETDRIEDSLRLLRTELQGREHRSTERRSESRRQRSNDTQDWQAMADRLTTTELENEILSLRSHASSLTEGIADEDDFTERLRIYEDNLLRRQEILNLGRRTNSMARQLTREQIDRGGGTAALALANLNNQASGAFGVAFFSSFLAELPPGDLQDANEDLRRNPLQFQGGYLVGLPVGVWHGLTGLLEGLWGLVQFASNFTAPAIISRLGREASEYYNNPEEYMAGRQRNYEQLQAIYLGLQQFGEEFREDPTVIMQLSSDLGETLGVHMATSFIEDFVRKSAYEKGRISGDIVGMIVFEILLEIILAVTTEGVGNLIRGIGAIGQGARASGRLASAIRRLLNASPAIRKLLRSLNIGEDILDTARTTENVLDVVEDVADIPSSVDNVIPFPSERAGTTPSPLSQRGSEPVTNLDEFRQRRQAVEMPEAANNTHFPDAEDNVMPIPIEEELPVAVGQTHGPTTSGVDPNTPQAMASNSGGNGNVVPPEELQARRTRRDAQTQRRQERQRQESARARPMDSRPAELAELQIRASRQAGRIMADAEAGHYVGASLETRQRLIRLYRRQLEHSGLDQVVVNNRVGRLNELFSETPRIVREGRAQTAFRSGERVLDDASLRGSSIPDITRVRSINGQTTRVHFNLKSDRIDQLSLGQATSRARRYTDTAEVQVFGAQTNETRRLRGGNLGSPERRPLRRGNRFGNLPEGEPPGIEYLFAPSREVQEAMVLEHFRPSSPIVEVRFGSITYVRTPTGFIRN